MPDRLDRILAPHQDLASGPQHVDATTVAAAEQLSDAYGEGGLTAEFAAALRWIGRDPILVDVLPSP